MAIDQENLVMTARELLTEADPALTVSIDRLNAFIQPALTEFYQRTLGNAEKRKNFLVEIEDVEIASGVADLTTIMDQYGVLSEMVKESEIDGYDYGKTPLLQVRFVNSRNRLILGGIQDQFYLMAYFDGKKLYFSDTALSGQMTMRVPVIPQTLDKLPAAMTGELARIIAEFFKKFDHSRNEQKGVDLAMQKDARK